MSILSHASLGVAALDRAVVFYDAALAPLGVVRLWQYADAAGYGRPGGEDELAVFAREPGPRGLAAGPGFHLCLRAPDAAAVDAFWRAALDHGGTDAGAPGLRPHYGPDYYAAFVRDPDGHKLEVKVQTG